MVKHRRSNFGSRHVRSSSWKRTRLVTFILFTFVITQLAFVVTWNYRSSRAAYLRQLKAENVERTSRTLMKFQSSVHELAGKLKNGFGRRLMIEYAEPHDKNSLEEDIVFNYERASFPKKIHFPKSESATQAMEAPGGYVRVYSKYWEQMTMNLRALVALTGQAKRGGRKVLEPRVKNSGFSRSGHSLGTYFNITHFNNILSESNYATLADEKEYDAKCSLASSSHVIIHFLYTQKGADFTKQKLHLSDKEYETISNEASIKGWTECPALKNFVKENGNSKEFCVDPSKMNDWNKMENDVFRGATCVTIAMWRGIGGGFRAYFDEKDFEIKARDVQFALKPDAGIISEAQSFTDHVLRARYIAIQVRGEHVVIPHNLDRLRKCLRILADVVKALKLLSNISQVFIASDMSNFGSGSWKGILTRETLDMNPLRDLHSYLISSTGGVEYSPSAGNVDRGVVALIEMTLIANAEYLITIGSGSFQEWAVAKFLEHHRSDVQSLWSLITVCSK